MDPHRRPTHLHRHLKMEALFKFKLLSDFQQDTINSLFQDSMNFLVFSHQQDVRCCVLVDESHLLLATDEGLAIFDVGTAKTEKYINFECGTSKFSPIAIFESQSNNELFTIQGKMNTNLIYEISRQNYSITFVKAYHTGICGFVPMIHTHFSLNQSIMQVLISVNDEKSSIDCICINDGRKMGTFLLQQKKLCEAVSCAAVQLNRSKGVIEQMFLCQQGCLISRFILQQSLFHEQNEDKEISSDEEREVKTRDQIQIPCKGDILIIRTLVLFPKDGKIQLACAVRLQPRIYIMSKDPNLQIINTIQAPAQCNMISHIFVDETKQLMLLAASNALFTLHDAKLQKREELKQSKDINWMHMSPKHLGILVGCSCEHQFFYWQA